MAIVEKDDTANKSIKITLQMTDGSKRLYHYVEQFATPEYETLFDVLWQVLDSRPGTCHACMDLGPYEPDTSTQKYTDADCPILNVGSGLLKSRSDTK